MDQKNYEALCDLDHANLPLAKNPNDLFEMLEENRISAWGFCGAATRMLIRGLDLKEISDQIILVRGELHTVIVDGCTGVSLKEENVYSERLPYDL